MAHAELSPSSAHRWLVCPGSIIKTRGLQDPGSAYAEEGTRAHDVAERCVLALRTGEIVECADADMLQHGQDYAAYIAALGCEDWETERRFDLTPWIPASFGTADFVGVAGSNLHVVDYKYGKGVRVDAAENPQLMCYGLGAWFWWSAYYEVERVHLHVFQPRKDHIDSWTCTPGDLLAFGERAGKIAERALLPGAPVVAGEHCQFCLARGKCPEQAAQVLAAAQNAFGLLDRDELAEAYSKVPMVKEWLTAVTEAAERTAREPGGLPGFKWVEGRSIRRWRDEEQAAEALRQVGADPYTRKIIGITEGEKLLGKDAMRQLCEKPEGKPALVPASDPRPALDTGAIFED